MARKHSVTLEKKEKAIRPAVVPPRTKAEAEVQIKDFIESHKRSLDALARL